MPGWYRSIVAAVVLVGCSPSPMRDGDLPAVGREAGFDAAGSPNGPVEAGPPPEFVYGPPNDASSLPGLLSSVQIVVATWNGDEEDLRTSIAAAFGPPGIGESAWWGALSGYCVPGGAPCVGRTVTVTSAHIGDAPGLPFVDSAIAQSTHDDSFARFIRDKSQLGTGMDGGAVLPPPVTPSTLYVFFLPLALPANAKGPGLQPGWSVTVDGAPSCGYHSGTVAGPASAQVAYVVVPRCQVPGRADADVAIARAFREIADAVTDPFRAVGCIGFHNLRTPPQGFEIGDVCDATTGADGGIAGFSVPEIWSNESASCVP